MPSRLDSPEFSSRLFFPRFDRSPPPVGAREVRVVADDGVGLQCRLHEAKAGVGLVLFPGNGEVASDDWQAPGAFVRSLG